MDDPRQSCATGRDQWSEPARYRPVGGIGSISMDGRGRALDNVFVERLWRSVKYAEVYLKDYASVPETRAHRGGIG